MIINLSRRAHDHNWEIDPITRSLLDTDFYKFLMLQFIWKCFPRTRASFSLINRSTDIRLAELPFFGRLRAGFPGRASLAALECGNLIAP